MVDRFFLVLIMAVVLLQAGQPAFGAEVTAQLDRNPVRADESVELIVAVTGKADGKPDFTVLEKDFEILSQRSSTSMQVINGKTSHSVIYQLDLMPKRAGRLQIPPLTIGPDSSRPLELVVQKAQNVEEGTSQPASDLFLEVSVDTETPYVDSQVVYTVRLYLAVSLSSASLSEPQAGTVAIEKLGDDHEFTTSRNSMQYRVVERRYVLFPETPGPLKIEPVVFQGQVGRRSTSLFDQFNRRGPTRRLRSRSVSLEAQPRPADYQGPWLPSRKLEIGSSWSAPPDALRAGEPVTLTLSVNGSGLRAAQLPDPKLDLPAGVKQYPDQAKLENIPTAEGLVGTLTQKVALIFNEPGEYTLPAMKLPWWNTVSERMEHAELPAQEVLVLPGTLEPEPPQIVQGQELPGPALKKVQGESQPTTPLYEDVWFLVSMVLASGWLVTLLLWWKTAARTRMKTTEKFEAAKGHHQAGQLSRELRRACRGDDPAAAKRALTALQKFSASPSRDGSYGSTDEEAQLKTEVERLNSHLYGAHEHGTAWDGARLWDAWRKCMPDKDKSEQKQEGLRQLYPKDKP